MYETRVPIEVEIQPVPDEQVADFIKRKLRKQPEVTASPLLRSLRESGLACEQKRFGRIFKEIREVARG